MSPAPNEYLKEFVSETVSEAEAETVSEAEAQAEAETETAAALTYFALELILSADEGQMNLHIVQL